MNLPRTKLSNKPSKSADGRAHPAVLDVLTWYFENAYGVIEGPGVVPFYCDPIRVGQFAVQAHELAAGRESGLFRLLIAHSMFQARRDVLVMRQQLAIHPRDANSLLSPTSLRRAVAQSTCATLESSERFETECSVKKRGAIADCSHHRGAPCHVKSATILLKRMGDMGKLPTSAWLRLFRDGSLTRVLGAAVDASTDPRMRALLLVESFSKVHRVGRKLATMFVGALSTPALAPGLTPWFPRIDGYELVVVDTNVAHAVALLRRRPSVRPTYESASRWISRQASRVDLRSFDATLPTYSPRLVQQALYVFCSKSSRVGRGDPCAQATTPCARCVRALCPFSRNSQGAE